MLNSIVKWAIAQRWLVVIASIIISLWGFRVLTQMPLDVFPNFAPPQVEIQTEAPGTRTRGSRISRHSTDRKCDQWYSRCGNGAFLFCGGDICCESYF
jgi:hypothetical protein